MKNQALSYLFGILGVLIIVASLYFVISYLTFIGNVVIQFFSVNSTQKMSDCGIVMPPELIALRDQFPTTIIPALYLGLPVVLILIAGSMFLSGYYLGRHAVGMEFAAHRRRQEDIEAEVARRTGAQKKAGKPQEEEEEEEEEPAPKPKAAKK